MYTKTAKREKEEILKTYKIDEHKIIRSPGKYEGQMYYVPFFHRWANMMGADARITKENIQYDRFIISGNDIEIFPELQTIKTLDLHETENGSVLAIGISDKGEFSNAKNN